MLEDCIRGILMLAMGGLNVWHGFGFGGLCWNRRLDIWYQGSRFRASC